MTSSSLGVRPTENQGDVVEAVQQNAGPDKNQGVRQGVQEHDGDQKHNYYNGSDDNFENIPFLMSSH